MTNFKTLALSAILLSSVSVAAFAADVAPNSGVDQVNTRVEKQQKRIDNGVATGKLTEKQATKDEKSLEKTETKLSKDEAKHGGKITKKEQSHLNKGLNKNGKRIRKQKSTAVAPVTTVAPVTPSAQ